MRRVALKLPGTYCPEYELNASFGTIPIFGPVLTGGDNNCMFSLPFQIIRESWGENLFLEEIPQDYWPQVYSGTLLIMINYLFVKASVFSFQRIILSH